MECCRMFRLKCVVYFLLLWCELTRGAGLDNEMDTQNMLSERNKKLQELLKTLDSYSNDIHHNKSSEQNYTHWNVTLTAPNHSTLPETRARIATMESAELFAPGSIRNHQDFYQKMYGTQEGVRFLRKKYGPNGLPAARAKFSGVNRGIDDVKRANDHYLKMRNRARCRTPVPQVLKVKAYYPDPSKDYLPRCALLHRCGDETGCCESDAFHCVPKAIQEVTLHFYTFSVGRNGGDSKVERLLFQNHTSCHCQPINDLPRLVNDHDPLDGEEDHSPDSKCRDCPVPFTTRIYKDGRCGCDCFDKQRPCLRIKRGRDALSEIERRCVEANHCHVPECEYGAFDMNTGYCPRKNDQVPRRRRPTHHPPSKHSWAFLERD